MSAALRMAARISAAAIACALSACSLFSGRGAAEETQEEDVPARIMLRTGGITAAQPAPESDAGRENPTAADPTQEYRLKQRDPIRISIKPPNPDREIEVECVVDEAGVELWPLSKPVKLIGRTASEIEAEIRRQYIEVEKIYRNITVNVSVPQMAYSIGGEFRRNGRFPLAPGMTFIKAIDAAEGFTEFANKRKVQLIRKGKITVYDILEMRKTPAMDFELEAEDQIYATRSSI